MRVLCYVNHFFGPNPRFEGKSTDGKNTRRREIVARCLQQLRTLGDVDVRVCGIKGFSLQDIDLDFPRIRHDPTLLIYESIAHMAGFIDTYDYFINVEDDILVPRATLDNVVEFDRTALLNEVLHPNRLETDERGGRYCVDTELNRRWTYQRRPYQGRELRVAMNPHSAILILSREKFRYSLRNVDVGFRGAFLVYAMDSAFAYFLSPFCLYRSYNDLDFHHVIHLDRWSGSDAMRAPPAPEPAWRRRLKQVARECLPPVVWRAGARALGRDAPS